MTNQPLPTTESDDSVTIESNVDLTTDLSDPKLFLNRESSWIEFNRRCLEEAQNPTLPLLERVRFLAIFSNNLDEYYMVRVSGLKDQVIAGVYDSTPDGMSPQQQLDMIRARVLPMLQEQRRTFNQDILPGLAAEHVFLPPYLKLNDPMRSALRAFFEYEIFPVLTPLAVDPGRPFPHISNLSLNLAVMMTDEKGEQRFARVKVPSAVITRLVSINDVMRRYAPDEPTDGMYFAWLEDVILANLDLLFPGMKITASGAFRITRNSDLEIAEEEADDLLETIEESIRSRRFGQVVRMSVQTGMPTPMIKLLSENLDIDGEDCYLLDGPLGMSDLFALANIDMPGLKFAPFIPSRPIEYPSNDDIFASIRRGDFMMHRPYETFLPVEEFFQHAATDRSVLAIKATLYRVGRNSSIVQSLLRAQENGKQVAVLVELKARFDEENNITWARALEAKGVHVVYGLVGLKTHSKIALVVRREEDGIRRYVHLSTGNYNPSTARVYTDLDMFTCREEIAADATDLFNRLTGFATRTMYRKLFVAPEHMRNEIEARIEREIEHARAGHEARLIFKMNSLVDARMIRLLYQASIAGVKVDLLVRGICCLRPGVPGVSENIRVTCLIGRFLEHARVFYFRNGGDEQIYSGSADLMPRNLNNRVETIFPVESEPLRRRILDEILDLEMSDNVRARELQSDGSYVRRLPVDSEPPLDAQLTLLERNQVVR